ncbi:hypothetical protein ADU90_07870 (plasmid) [Clostridium botulinum]|uniref:hypothetical protein n=1 Tax=Clostridium botulinum TaxID=1491 RepID=UPI0006A46F71|nr:hypothetical protein [Clostridium botulinum]KOC56152.1 hypothetical protein ADU89_03685 [Clostridium botulinum]KOC56603.1 hypothetical protein ADU90_07870 [Clostridium botulinum]
MLKSIKYKNMYLLNDKSNLNLTLSTLGEESKLQSLSIYYNKNAGPSTKVIVRTQNNIKNTIHKSSSTITIEKCVIGLIVLIMCLMLVNLLYLTFKKPKNVFYMIKKLIKDTWNELNRSSIIFIFICWLMLNGAMYILNDYAVNQIIVYTCIALSIFILFMTIMGTKGYKLLKSINQEKFGNMPAILCSLFGITAYCMIMTISLNNIHIEFSNIQQKLILLISSFSLIIVYIFNMQILYNLIIYRCKIVKKSTPQKRFFNFCFLSIFVIICFISIFTSANFLSEYIDPDAFKDEPLNSHTTFDIFYYSASTFLTFCSENISAHTMLSKFICLLSKITTIISITVLISILTGLLPEDVDNYDKKHTKKIPNRKNNSSKHNKNAKNRPHN